MKFRTVHLLWLMLLGATIAMGSVALWLLGREANRVENLARETLVDRAMAVADNLDLLAGEIRTGIVDSLEALGGAADSNASLARLVSANPYIEAGFFLREADGVTFWYGDRGSLPDPNEMLTREDLNRQPTLSPAFAEMDLADDSLLADATLMEPMAPTDQIDEFREQRPSSISETVAETADPVLAGEGEQARTQTAKSALRSQISAVRSLNLSNQKQILGSSADASSPIAAESQPNVSFDSFAAEETGGPSLSRAPLSTDQDELPSREEGRAEEEDVPSPRRPDSTDGEAEKFRPGPISGWKKNADGTVIREMAWVRFPVEGQVVGAWLSPSAIRAELAKAVFLNERDGLRLRLSSPDGEILSGGEFSGASSYQSMGERAQTIEIPVGPALAGWRLQAFEPGGNPFGQSFRLIGAILVVGLVTAILVAGSLLLRQSRKDSLEAQRKTTFVANVSHELKTPLTSIRMFAEMLSDGRATDARKQTEYLDRISVETQRLGRLVNNVLDFSRLDRRSRRFHMEDRELVQEVANFCEAHSTRLRGEGLEVERDFSEAPVWVTMDRDALEQILLNLVDNALKYASEGESLKVEIQGACGNRGPELRVRDFGPGIHGREKALVFRAFHRVDDRLTSEQSGCGLGLSISKRLAEGMKVNFRLEENSPTGCCFILEWPNPTESST